MTPSTTSISRRTWGAASAAIIAGAGLLGAYTVSAVNIPTVREWVMREPGLKIQADLPPSITLAPVSPEVDVIRVPRILVSSLPTRLVDETDVAARKNLFIRTVLPLVLEVNDLVERDRDRLLTLKARLDRGVVLSTPDQKWLDAILAEYDLDDLDWDILLRRVDTVPPSLALAQAASESAWGTSRFAQNGNALFGQWAWTDDAGLIPLERREDESHVVRSFHTPLESVFAYLHNLNTHPFYQRFRTLRQEIRDEDPAHPGYTLASALNRYSERGDAYVQELRTIMRANDLQVYNHAELDTTVGELALNDVWPALGSAGEN